jgi:hypothetical protein
VKSPSRSGRRHWVSVVEPPASLLAVFGIVVDVTMDPSGASRWRVSPFVALIPNVAK